MPRTRNKAGNWKRSIENKDAPSYQGPSQIQNYYNAAHKKIKRKVHGVVDVQLCPYPKDSQRHFLTLWMSGCREGEAIMLSPGEWTFNEQAIGYEKAPVLKKRESVKDSTGAYVYHPVKIREIQADGSIEDKIIHRKLSRPKIEYREILIPRDYPLVEEFLDIVTDLEEKEYKYILYHQNKFSRAHVKDRSCTTRTVQNRITELHPKLFPHAIRALQARYFRDRYGRDFDTPELMNLFRWTTADMAVLYLGAQKMGEIMGITKLPF